MPRTITVVERRDWRSESDPLRRVEYEQEVATEEELLDFCNKVRDAGGADILEALLPSIPGDSKNCLIANSLNFGCEILPRGRSNDSVGARDQEWVMNVSNQITEEQGRAIAAVVGDDEPFYNETTGYWAFTLPRHIGNSANAFDWEAAFQDFNSDAI